jgi:hypothetical protein
MHLRYILYPAFLLGFLLASLWLIREYREAGQMQATGEEWERISNGYVDN